MTSESDQTKIAVGSEAWTLSVLEIQTLNTLTAWDFLGDISP